MKDILERYLTEREERLLFKTVRAFGDLYARRDAAWMQFLRNTGIRVGTMARLTVFDALEALRMKKLVLTDDICKRQGYSVPLNRKAVAALRALLAIHRETTGSLRPDSALVLSRKNKPLSVRSYQNRMKHWRETAGLTVKATPHFFRHTVGERIMKHSTAANPLLVVKAALGHARLDSTACYTRPTREQIACDMEFMS